VNIRSLFLFKTTLILVCIGCFGIVHQAYSQSTNKLESEDYQHLMQLTGQAKKWASIKGKEMG